MGQIVELLTESETDGFGIAVIDMFMAAATRHERFGMPYLVRRQTHPSFLIARSKVLSILPTYSVLMLTLAVEDIEFDFNVQHDCSLAGCGPTGKRSSVQERIKSSEATESFVEHNNVPQWILNTHSLHNGHLLGCLQHQEKVKSLMGLMRWLKIL